MFNRLLQRMYLLNILIY